MGLARGGVKFLLTESVRRPLTGAVLTLGRQDVFLTLAQLAAAARECGAALAPVPTVTLASKPALAARGCLGDETLFRALGFSTVTTLDVSGYEGAQVTFDLGSPELLEDLRERFDVVVDCGTLEHTFHIPNALGNVFRLLKPGGRVIHLAPSSNHIDHGFYMFSPTLFWDFYQHNRFQINTFQLIRSTPRHDVDPWEVYAYTPGCLEPLSYGGLDDAVYGICCIATRTPESTGDRVPQQGRMRAAWEAAAGSPETAPAPADGVARIRERLRSRPALFTLARAGFRAYVRLRDTVTGWHRRRLPAPRRLGLELVGRY